MSAPSAAASPDLAGFARAFVRERLGCGCPDEVLDRIEIDAPAGGSPLTRLRVGGRLLVHLRPCAQADALPRDLAAWLAAGTAERDALGYNRFRLVLATAEARALQPRASALFANLAGDARAHLHLVTPQEAGPLLPAPPRG